jgi:hypothetical protein
VLVEGTHNCSCEPVGLLPHRICHIKPLNGNHQSSGWFASGPQQPAQQ